MTTVPGLDISTVVEESGNHLVVVKAARVGYLAAPPSPAPRRGTVQWYVPYTAVHPQTAEAAPPDAIWVDVSHSELSYFGAMLSWWERGEDFATLEHDVVCRPDIIQSFEDCPEPWCVYPYDTICCQDETGYSPCMEAWRNELGCTRFRSELMSAAPDAVSSIEPGPLRDWHNLCDGLGNNLRAAGFTHHWHLPAAGHHMRVQRDA